MSQLARLKPHAAYPARITVVTESGMDRVHRPRGLPKRRWVFQQKGGQWVLGGLRPKHLCLRGKKQSLVSGGARSQGALAGVTQRCPFQLGP